MAPSTQKAAPPNSPFFAGCIIQTTKGSLSESKKHETLVTPPLLPGCCRPGCPVEGRPPGTQSFAGADKRIYPSSSALPLPGDGNPIHVLDFYLKTVHDESIRRGYNFDLSKISPCESRPHSLLLPDKQLEYEFLHLLDKLKERSPRQYSLLRQTAVPHPHPLFQITPGDICSWEKKPVSSLT